MKRVSSSVAYGYIRKRILSGEYPPAHALLTDALAAEIGVSRTPIRDALRQLESDGLVSIRPHLGATVRAMNLSEFREMCDLRLALETHAASLAARLRSDDDLKELAASLQAMRLLTARVIETNQDQAVLCELAREDVRFHIAILTASKNALIKKEILRLHLLNHVVAGPISDNRYLQPGGLEEQNAHRRNVLASHEDILRAITARDAQAARLEMERHIQEIIDCTLRSIVPPEPPTSTTQALTEEAVLYAH